MYTKITKRNCMYIYAVAQERKKNKPTSITWTAKNLILHKGSVVMFVNKATPFLDPISHFFSSFPTTSTSLASLNSLIRTLFSIPFSQKFFPCYKRNKLGSRLRLQNQKNFSAINSRLSFHSHVLMNYLYTHADTYVYPSKLIIKRCVHISETRILS